MTNKQKRFLPVKWIALIIIGVVGVAAVKYFANNVDIADAGGAQYGVQQGDLLIFNKLYLEKLFLLPDPEIK